MFFLTAQTVERFAGLPQRFSSFPTTLYVVAIKNKGKLLGCFLDHRVIFTRIFAALSLVLITEL